MSPLGLGGLGAGQLHLQVAPRLRRRPRDDLKCSEFLLRSPCVLRRASCELTPLPPPPPPPAPPMAAPMPRPRLPRPGPLRRRGGQSRRRPRPRRPSGRQLSRFPARQFPRPAAPGLKLPTQFPIVRGSAPSGPKCPRIVRGRCPEPESNHGVESGGQGRNRTNDTRIFSSSESPVRREKAEETERVFDRPTEPPSPTEPIPNPT